MATPGRTETLENLPIIADVPEKEQVELVEKKLNLCSEIFDFTTNDRLAEKDRKRQALLELVEYVSGHGGVCNDTLMPHAMDMIATNLCRTLPPHTIPMMERDDDEPVFDVAWPHLQIVYEFFLRVVVSPQLDSKMAKKYFLKPFLVQIIELFDSEDPRERDYLKTILHRIYGKGMSLRSFIRRSFNNVFFRFIFEEESFNGIGEVLEILGSIINGFTVPLKPEHVRFFHKALIPLHKAHSLPMFHGQLTYCVTQFVEKDPTMAVPLILALLHHWPHVDSGKEVLFLNELEEIFDLIQPAEFQKVLRPVFIRLGQCIVSPHFQVAQRTLALWNSEYLVSLVAQRRQSVLPLLYGPLQTTYKEHWNSAVQSLSYNVLKLFMDMDGGLFDKCSGEHAEKSERSSNRRRQTGQRWELVERMAHTRVADLEYGEDEAREQGLLTVEVGSTAQSDAGGSLPPPLSSGSSGVVE